VISYLRKEKRQLQQGRGVRPCERNNSADSKVSEGGRANAPGFRTEIPLQPVEKTVVRQVAPLQSIAAYGGADIYLPEQVDVPQRSL